MKRITTISTAALVALGSTTAATIPAASAPTPKLPTVSVTITDGDAAAYCALKWSARGLVPGTAYSLIFDPGVASAQFTADARGTAKGDVGAVNRDVYNKTIAVTTRLYVQNDGIVQTNTKVANRCPA